jgi:glycosyltransferase involved in cell wall biosynthesis
VPNAFDLQHFARDEARGRDFRRNLGIADEQILVGYVGTLGFINGVSYLARLALALKDDSRFVFLTVGDGQERVRIESLARSSGILGRNFRMISGVAKNDVPAVFSALDVAISLFLPIPEMEANSANKFFDALASGCCVAINYGGWQETLLRESGAGIRLSADPSRAAAELQAAAVDPAQRRRAGLCARALAETEFGRDALVEKVRRVLTDVVDATG